MAQGKRGSGYRVILEVLERRLLVATLLLHGWRRGPAAEALGLSPQAIGQRCRRYGLSAIRPRQVRRPRVAGEPRARRARHGMSGTRLTKWEQLPPAAPTAYPIAVYLERHATMARMLSEGATYQQIGDVLGLTRERVRQLCHRLGLDHHAGRRVRAAATGRREVERWRGQIDSMVASVVAWFDAQGVAVEPRGRSRFWAGELVFCVHRARAPRLTTPTSRVRYFHFHGRCSSGTDYIVFVTGDGRRFVLPRSDSRATIFIREDHDGRWSRYRERWPSLAGVTLPRASSTDGARAVSNLAGRR